MKNVNILFLAGDERVGGAGEGGEEEEGGQRQETKGGGGHGSGQEKSQSLGPDVPVVKPAIGRSSSSLAWTLKHIFF